MILLVNIFKQKHFCILKFYYSITEESKCCSEAMKMHFNKELVMTKESKIDFKTLVNAESVTMIMLIVMLK